MGKSHYSQEEKLTILKSAEKIGIKEAAKIVNVHYATVYDWRNALKIKGKKEFLTYKPLRASRGIKEITPQQEESILKTWDDNRGYGPGQIRNQLRRQGTTISIRTIRKILKANGYEAQNKRENKKDIKRFEAGRPLELAQMDILEFFINKLKIYLILLLDDFSRFILGWRLIEQTSVKDVIAVVQEAIDRYGKMEELLTDRGFVFYSWRGINRFEKYLEINGIDHTHARAHHPQTLGKVEAWNRRIKYELIIHHHFENTHEAKREISNWIENYNYMRPHQGIGGLLVPAERFHGQSKGVLSAIEKGIDVSARHCYSFGDIERSIINLVMEEDGKITMYIMGQPIMLTGGIDVTKNEPR